MLEGTEPADFQRSEKKNGADYTTFQRKRVVLNYHFILFSLLCTFMKISVLGIYLMLGRTLKVENVTMFILLAC